MITINHYSMSVKELFTRLSVLLVMYAFAVSAKATPTITPIQGDDKGYTITINEPADFDIFNDGNNVFYTEEDGTKVKVSEVKELVIDTKSPHKLDRVKAKTMLDNCTSLDVLDLENCDVVGVDKIDGGNPFLSNGSPNPFKNRLKTLVFPKTAGMIIPASAFEGDTELETVVFPDNSDSYQIMNSAFKNSKIKTVSLGRGYSIPDMEYDGGQWASATGSGESIFEHCTELTNVVLDNSITALGVKAFAATYNIEYLVLPEDLVNIGHLCFKECGIRTVTIPDNVNIGPTDQIFQGCVRLNNVFVNSDNVAVRTQGLMEMNQTFNFRYIAGDNPSYSAADYQATSKYNSSDYQDSPFVGQFYSIPILHYPGTVTAIDNYRVPFYMHYHGVDPETGTTWPNQYDIDNKENGEVNNDPYEIVYPGYTSYWNVTGKNEYDDPYAGWRQFLIGNNTFKEQRVFYDERIKESRWYSICLPINMTEAQFMNAYGVGAALHEFTGAEYDEENNTIVLKFDTPAQVEGGYLLKKNVPYMIHPAKIKFSKRKEVQTVPGGVEFVKETVEGQEQYATTEVIATFDVESDLFVNWDILLNGGQPFSDAIAIVETNTTTALEDNAQTRRFTHDRFPSVDFTFKGSYLGATIYGPADASGKQKQMGVPQDLPKGAYYLGYQAGMSQPKFFKAKGTTNGWSPYCALVEAADVTAGGDSGAKDFNVLDVDFNNTDVVVTKIGSPTIQIPVIKTDSKVYNLNGQVVRENSKDTNGLKGIYVVGGKKVVFN